MTRLGLCEWCAADGKRLAITDRHATGERKWLTIKETAELLDVSRDKVSRLIAARVLSATQIGTPARPTGNRWRIFRHSVDELVRSQEQDPRRPNTDSAYFADFAN